jgi:hypothetical protein
VWAFTQPAELGRLLAGTWNAVTGSVSEHSVTAFQVPKSVVSVAKIDGRREAALRTDTHALLLPLNPTDDEPREPLLFEKPDDRWEVNDLRQPNVEMCDELEAELRKRVTGDSFSEGAPT